MEFILKILEYFNKGGLVMYPLLICSIIVVAISIERYLYFKTTSSGSQFTERFCVLLREEKLNDALNLSTQTKGDTARIMYESIQRIQKGKKNTRQYLETESNSYIDRLQYHLSYLSVVVTMAPLLGLLGTIIGMISSFSVFDLQSGQPTAITGGIAEALIATATGICVALISLVAHSYFTHNITIIISNLEECCAKLLETTDI